MLIETVTSEQEGSWHRPLTLASRTFLPLAGGLRTDSKLHSQGLAAARGMIDRGINNLIDGVHQAGHVLGPT